MPAETRPRPTFALTARDVADFRLRRHHLRDATPADAVAICRDICGVQAQVMSAAYLQLWARNHAITRGEIEDALWQSRTLVKTSLMRQTLHLIAADEFSLYVTALKGSRVAAVLRIMARFGITREEADALTAVILDVLSSGPLGQPAIRAAIRPRVSKRVRAWMEKVTNMLRVPVAEGRVCYGPGEDNEIRFICIGHWLPELEPISELNAQCALFRKYLRAYGPATVSDFAHWSGIPVRDSKLIYEHVKDELAPVSVEGETRLITAADRDAFTDQRERRADRASQRSDGRASQRLRVGHGAHPGVPRVSRADKSSQASAPPAPARRGSAAEVSHPDRQAAVNLLPAFDAYLLAHAEKHHLVEPSYYKRVYHSQWWISAVILLDGRIAGTWSYKLSARNLKLQIAPFAKLPRDLCGHIESEAASLANFFAKDAAIEWTA